MKTYRSPDHPLVVESLLGGLDNWDAEYFIFNAHSGYKEHEQTMAFFPLLPIAMKTLSSTLFFPLSFLLPQRSISLLSGVAINALAFPLATVCLYLLTLELSQNNRKLSLLAAGFFSLNPASVFMSAVYSETLFSLFTFAGLLALEKRRPWLSAVVFSLASFTRSNGIVLCGFLGYQCLENIFSTILLSEAYQSSCHKLWLLGKCLCQLCVCCLQCLVTVAPFYGFQLYGYIIYCEMCRSTPVGVWCNRTLPFPYSFIQEHYWNVGFLNYYRWKQLPNFLLASPIVLLTLFCVGYYFTGGWSLGSLNSKSTRHSRPQVDGAKGMRWSVTPLLNVRLRPYIFHLLFLCTFGVFNMHIQVRSTSVSTC